MNHTATRRTRQDSSSGVDDIATHPVYTCAAGMIPTLHALDTIAPTEVVHYFHEEGKDISHLLEDCYEGETTPYSRTVDDLIATPVRWCVECDPEHARYSGITEERVQVIAALSHWKDSRDDAYRRVAPERELAPQLIEMLIGDLISELLNLTNYTGPEAQLVTRALWYDLDQLLADRAHRALLRRRTLLWWADDDLLRTDQPPKVPVDPRLAQLPDLVPARAEEIRTVIQNGTDDDVLDLYDAVCGPPVWVENPDWDTRTALIAPNPRGFDLRLFQIPSAALWLEHRLDQVRGTPARQSLVYVPVGDEQPDDVYAAAEIAGSDSSRIAACVRAIAAART